LKRSIVCFALVLSAAQAMAQEVPKDGPSPVLDACRVAALANLREKSPDTKDVVLDPDASAVSKADTKVGDVPITAVAMGEAYLEAKGKGKPYRFVCLLTTGGKPVLTFFTQQ
jgi:hypothetical protein